MKPAVGDMILVGEHGDGSPRYARITAVLEPPPGMGDACPIHVEPEPYRPMEIAPGVFTLDTLNTVMWRY